MESQPVWFHLSTAITPVFETVNLRIAGVKSSSTGINQLFLEPVDITRDFGSLHALLSEHLYVPVGQHNTDNPASVNAGYLAANTQLAFTWIPTPRWDVTSWSSFGTQTRDSLTHYQSGNYVDEDFGGELPSS